MEVFIVFMLMMFSGSVLSDENALLKPCDTTDMHCLSQSTEKFLEQTHKGISRFNIVPIDPLLLPTFDIVFADDGITYKNTNLTVTGLKNQKISDFKMNTADKSVVLTTQADLNMVSDLTVVLTKSSKKFHGHYTAHGSVLGTATYNYELVMRDGIQYFEVGPETITCKVVRTPTVELSPELSKKLANDVDAKAFSEEKRTELIEKAFCKAVEASYKDVVHNIRAAAKFLPASAFFNNI